MEERGLLGTLTDLSFSSFVTVRIVRVLYAIGVVFAALLALGVLLWGLMSGSGLAALLGIFLAPVVLFVGALLVRVYLELLVVLFTIAENVARIDRHLSGDEGVR